ncbi:MAG: hypothetical protein GX614_02475 [Sandaracinaceae bacterium]|nr:hypothetical protein [Sandaracinaceae bacterium]
MGVALLAFASMRRQTARCVGRPVFGLTPSGLLSATAAADVPEQGLGVEPESVRRAEEPSRSARGDSEPIASAPTSVLASRLRAASRVPAEAALFGDAGGDRALARNGGFLRATSPSVLTSRARVEAPNRAAAGARAALKSHP